MVDIIIFTFALAVFMAGFWCGARFTTYSAMAERAKAWAKGLLA